MIGLALVAAANLVCSVLGAQRIETLLMIVVVLPAMLLLAAVLVGALAGDALSMFPRRGRGVRAPQ